VFVNSLLKILTATSMRLSQSVGHRSAKRDAVSTVSGISRIIVWSERSRELVPCSGLRHHKPGLEGLMPIRLGFISKLP
jgi:hypothetical protein